MPLVDSIDYVIPIDRGDQKPFYNKLHDGWYLYYGSWQADFVSPPARGNPLSRRHAATLAANGLAGPQTL